MTKITIEQPVSIQNVFKQLEEYKQYLGLTKKQYAALLQYLFLSDKLYGHPMELHEFKEYTQEGEEKLREFCNGRKESMKNAKDLEMNWYTGNGASYSIDLEWLLVSFVKAKADMITLAHEEDNKLIGKALEALKACESHLETLEISKPKYAALYMYLVISERTGHALSAKEFKEYGEEIHEHLAGLLLENFETEVYFDNDDRLNMQWLLKRFNNFLDGKTKGLEAYYEK